MTRKPSTMTCVGALVAGLAAPAFGAQTNQTQTTDALTERQAQEVRTLIHEVLADAETRSSMLDGSGNAGHDGNNFFIGSDDDRFRLNVGGQIQVRFLANIRDENDAMLPGSEDASVWGFEVPRAKLNFWGHIANPRLEYRVSVASDLRDTFVGEQLFLQDALISYELQDGISVWVGQGKAPYMREELVSSSRQLAVERSVVNQFFTVGRVQGLGVDAEVHEMVRVAGVLSNGTRSGEPAHRQVAPIAKPGAAAPNARGFLGNNSDFALTGRVDVKVAGDWDQANDFTAWVGDPMAIFVGAAGHFEKGRTGTSADNDDFWSWTVDGSVQHLGWNAYGSINHLRTDLAEGNHAEIWGLMAQGGYNIDDTYEPFVRYEYLDISSSGMMSGPDGNYINIVTAGVNWYHNQHNAKLTADVVWALDGVPASALLNTDPSQLRLLGLQPDATDQDDQVALRVQYQLLF